MSNIPGLENDLTTIPYNTYVSDCTISMLNANCAGFARMPVAALQLGFPEVSFLHKVRIVHRDIKPQSQLLRVLGKKEIDGRTEAADFRPRGSGQRCYFQCCIFEYLPISFWQLHNMETLR